METTTRLFLNDARWSCIVDHLQKVRQKRGRPGRDDRRFVEASVWIMRTGSPWRDLPRSLGRWQTVYKRFSRWAKSGLWRQIYSLLREAFPENCCVGSLDSTSIRVHQHGSPPKTMRDVKAVGVSRGGKTTKLHCLAYATEDGRLVAARAMLSAGHRADITAFAPILRKAPASLHTLIADRAYDADWVRAQSSDQGVVAVVPYRANRLCAGKLDVKAYRKRNEVERFFCRIKQFRRVATRFDRRAVHFTGFLHLAFVAAMVTVPL